jgi:hypothetical protein
VPFRDNVVQLEVRKRSFCFEGPPGCEHTSRS